MQEDTRKKIEELEKALETLSVEFHNYKMQKAEEESRRLRTALIWAGGVITAIAAFMWSEIIWPAIKAGRP